MLLVIALSLLLVAYNAALNLLPVARWAYVPMNLLAAGALGVLGRSRGLTWEELGLAPSQAPTGLGWGLLTVLAVGAAVAAGVRWEDQLPAVEALLDDERAAGMSTGQLLYHLLLRIPLGTAVLEELAFRGVLLALITRQRSVLTAVVVSSLVFGLWHIGPGLETLRLNRPTLSGWELAGGLAGTVAVTSVAGVGFCLLRLGSGSLLAPVLAHWATNAFGLAGAAVAQRSG